MIKWLSYSFSASNHPIVFQVMQPKLSSNDIVLAIIQVIPRLTWLTRCKDMSSFHLLRFLVTRKMSQKPQIHSCCWRTSRGEPADSQGPAPRRSKSPAFSASGSVLFNWDVTSKNCFWEVFNRLDHKKNDIKWSKKYYCIFKVLFMVDLTSFGWKSRSTVSFFVSEKGPAACDNLFGSSGAIQMMVKIVPQRNRTVTYDFKWLLISLISVNQITNLDHCEIWYVYNILVLICPWRTHESTLLHNALGTQVEP